MRGEQHARAVLALPVRRGAVFDGRRHLTHALQIPVRDPRKGRAVHRPENALCVVDVVVDVLRVFENRLPVLLGRPVLAVRVIGLQRLERRRLRVEEDLGVCVAQVLRRRAVAVRGAVDVHGRQNPLVVRDVGDFVLVKLVAALLVELVELALHKVLELLAGKVIQLCGDVERHAVQLRGSRRLAARLGKRPLAQNFVVGDALEHLARAQRLPRQRQNLPVHDDRGIRGRQRQRERGVQLAARLHFQIFGLHAVVDAVVRLDHVEIQPDCGHVRVAVRRLHDRSQIGYRFRVDDVIERVHHDPCAARGRDAVRGGRRRLHLRLVVILRIPRDLLRVELDRKIHVVVFELIECLLAVHRAPRRHDCLRARLAAAGSAPSEGSPERPRLNVRTRLQVRGSAKSGWLLQSQGTTKNSLKPTRK